MDKEYFAFISYKSEDVEWAIWLQHELEHYHLPASFNGRTDVRQELRPVFRDIDELSAGNLPNQIKQALTNSQNLIVVCSPQAAKSPWVNQEVETFITLGKTDRIFPFIVEGNSPSDFFPPALFNLPKNEERLGGDVSKNGRDAAFVKIVAGMLGVGFDSLWNRYEKEKAEEERKIREQRDNLLRVQSRFLAEKANALVDEGDSFTARLLALEALPKDIEKPDRPYTPEAEAVLRKAYLNNNRKFLGHHESVTDISISPDNQVLASVSLDNFIRLWDIHTGKCLMEVQKPLLREGEFGGDVLDGITKEIDYIGFNSVEFSPDGLMLVTAGRDGTAYVWSLPAMECICRMNNSNPYITMCHATFSPDMNYIVSAGDLHEYYEWETGIKVWEIDKDWPYEMRTTQIDVADSKISEFTDFSPDGTCFASVSEGHVEIWDAKTYKRLFVLEEPEETAPSAYLKSMVKFSPDGQQIASSLADRIRIWDFYTKKILQTIQNNGLTINCLTYSADGRFIVYGGDDKIVHFWDIEKAQESLSFQGHTNSINAIAVSKDGQYVISAGKDYSIRLWNLNTDNFISSTPRIWNSTIPEKAEATCANGKRKAFWDYEDNVVCIRTTSGVRDFYLWNSYLTDVDFFTFSPNGENLLMLSNNMEICICRHLSDLEKEVKRRADSHPWYSEPEIFAPEEQDLLILKGHTGVVRCAAYSPDGEYVASGSEDYTLRIWNVSYGQCLLVFKGHTGCVVEVDFAPDGHSVISKSDDGTVKTWSFPPLQHLINDTKVLFDERSFTPEERKKFYLD